MSKIHKVSRGVLYSLVFILSATNALCGQDWSKIAPELQKSNVSIHVGRSTGSGVLVTREIVGPDGKKKKYNFVLTCAHVVDGLRVRVVAPEGIPPQYHWNDAEIIKIAVTKDGEVGKITLKAKVLAFSDSEMGHDLALLMILGDKIIDANTEFDLSGKPHCVGCNVLHIGSPNNQHHSVTTGIVSFVNRVLKLGKPTYFDQICVSALPGSSGGAIYSHEGKYIGMLVRQFSDNFNLMVPARRISEWTKEAGIEWVLDASIEMPTLEEINKLEPPKE